MLAPHARDALREGVETYTAVLAPTLGPVGRTVLIEHLYGKDAPEVVSRGDTVARRVTGIPNRYVNAGAMMIRHLAYHVRQNVGDGSVTAAVLARALVRGGNRMVAAGANPMLMRRGIERGARVAVAELAKMSQPLDSVAATGALARASTGDPELADLIAEVFDYVGADGIVLVEDYVGSRNDRQYVQGVRWDGPLASPGFITDEARRTAVVTNPLIALATKAVSSGAQIQPVMEAAMRLGAEGLVIIAPEFEGEPLGILLLNHRQNKLPAAALKAPGPTLSKPLILQDLAVLAGATLVDDKLAMDLAGFQPRYFGRARRVVASRTEFTIVGARGRPKDIRMRMAELQAEIDAMDRQEYPTRWEVLRRRLANLSGGVGILKVRSRSEPDARLKKALAEDAVLSVRSALEEGTVPGGGAAYVACIPAVEALAQATADRDEAIGVRVVAEALQAPVQQIATNAGHSGSTIAAKLRARGPGYAFDALSGEIVATREAGILDPAKVARVALEMAASNAAMTLTTDAIVLTERYGGFTKPRDGGEGTLVGTSITP